ncbi:class I SAM-dependent methyltransferase [Streptomyces sp. S186]|uniref:class I SAM-dependent methyltransferase n=1 Tax=Streptomyces sp. S186 TaxID=3434395 RepID=UPI003F681EEC
MPFDHNDHYHRLLLRHLPRNCGTALDVGCGTGRFARRLAGLGVEVDAIDPSAQVIAQARALSERSGAHRPPDFRQADAIAVELPPGHYDFISCLASLHHMPFDTVTRLRNALAPGGVLVVLGCYREQGLSDGLWSLAAAPTNALIRLAVAATETARPTASPRRPRTKAPVKQPTILLPEIRHRAAALLPGSRIRRLLFWRYLLVFHNET